MLATMDHFRVLIVDDSLVIRGLLAKILDEDAEIEVAAAVSSAESAEKILRSEAIDVVTLDEEMPITSGIEFLPTMRRFKIPTILLSGRATVGSDLRGSALLLGATACFDKADAARGSAFLIQLVKSAGRGEVVLDAADLNALERARKAAKVPDVMVRAE